MNTYSNTFSSILNNNKTSGDYSAYTESFVVYENFDVHGYSATTSRDGNVIINNQVTPLMSIADDYSQKLQKVNQNYIDLSANINVAKKVIIDISGNKFYDYNTEFKLDKPKTALDGLIYDNNILNTQENAVYVLGTITAATLIVFAIVIGKE